jgi:hypothetical protein
MDAEAIRARIKDLQNEISELEASLLIPVIPVTQYKITSFLNYPDICVTSAKVTLTATQPRKRPKLTMVSNTRLV